MCVLCGLVLTLLAGCTSGEVLDPEQPVLANYFTGLPARAVPPQVLRRLEGIFQISDPTAGGGAGGGPANFVTTFFGSEIVGKVSGRYFSFFTGTNRYIVLRAGLAEDSSIIFRGYWRSALGIETARIGQVGFTLAAADVQRVVRAVGAAGMNPTGMPPVGMTVGMPPSGSSQGMAGIGGVVGIVSIAGTAVGLQRPGETTQLELKYGRAFPNDINRQFIIVAHRAGRHDDIRTHSENSLKALRMIEQIGANAAEIDIRLTKDNVPVLFHDAELTTREVLGEFAIGPIGNYTYEQLRALCTYRDGEPIPTLDDALETVLTETTLEYLWLDIKEPALVSIVIPKLKALQRRLQAMPTRRLTVWFGLAYNDVNAAFIAHPDYKSIPSIVDNVENEEDEVDKTGAVAWSSRWTLGNQRNEILAGKFQERKIKVLYWTLNQPDILRSFIAERFCDGVITDRPYLTNFIYHTTARNKP
jgi:glycerophosphoryl diester phosphodiesterase